MISKIEENIEIPYNARDTSVSKKEANFLYHFVKEQNIQTTLEVGLGYGYSAAYIIEAHTGLHYAIDPYQRNYNFLGVKNLKKLGYEKQLLLIDQKSDQALPQLVKDKISIDLAFIDGGHKYDDIFIDFYFLDQLLKTSGHIIFHDAWMRSTQLTASWVKTNKTNYKIKKTAIPNLILFQKISPDDKREWSHFNEFYTGESRIKHKLFNIFHKYPMIHKIRTWVKSKI